jgi:copper chaperone CopZ
MPVNATKPPVVTEEFCSSLGEGMVMYMGGFKWTSMERNAACLGLFFGSWKLDTPWKFALACVGVFVLGVAMEAVSLARRQLPSRRQRDVGYVFHATNLLLAYLVMLVIMMYSIELFIFVMLGLVIGHITASKIARRLVMKRVANTENLQSECACPSEIVPDLGAGTPCCRLTLGMETSARTPTGTPTSSFANQNPDPTALLAALHEQKLQHQKEVALTIQGMTCGSCVSTVRKSLMAVQGVVVANVHLQKNIALVGYNPPANVEELCSAVESVGFEAAVSSTSMSLEGGN